MAEEREGEARPPRRCPACGAAELRFSHRAYAGSGRSRSILQCTACGASVGGATRDDADRRPTGGGRSRRHQPVDEGPPANPVLDADLARRLLEQLGE